MSIKASLAIRCGALAALGLTALAAAQDPADPLEIKSIAEVESRTVQAGREIVKLIPADRVAPGDRVIYTLAVRNTGATAIAAPSVSYAIPEHMRYIADSAVGPGAEVRYSIDRGRSFETPDSLNMRGPDGRLRPAVAADYTDIRWQLKNILKPNSVAFVRFRALVK
jgi:uncharacterized repeat protein (TIGR01451 family)